MPTERFYHLPEEKKRKIQLAAVEEFSRVSLDKVSINKIVQSAEISRGSFYTYFEDKNDLLNYIMVDLRTTTISRLVLYLKESGGDFFQTIDRLMVDVLHSPQVSHSDFFKNVLTGLTLSNNLDRYFWGFPKKDRDSSNLEQTLYELTDLSGWVIASQENFHDLLEMVAILVISTIGKTLLCSTSADESLAQFRRKLYYMKNGVLSRNTQTR